MKHLLLALSLAALMSVASAQYAPTSAVECIAPANPGGGWDFTCRSIETVLKDLNLINGQAYNVVNMSGGGGGVAMAHAVENRQGDNNLIVAASTSTAARLAAGQFGEYTIDSITPLAIIGADFAVISVLTVSPLQSIDDMIAALQADPSSITFGGGSATGGLDHIKAMLLAQAIGVDPLAIKYVPYSGGGEAMTAMLGGFIDAMTGDASETVGQVQSGDVRVLAVMAPERMSEPYHEAPTLKEIGYDVVLANWRGYYMAPGVSDDAYSYWTDVMSQVASSEQWIDIRKNNSLETFTLMGQEAKDYMADQVEVFRDLLKALGLL